MIVVMDLMTKESGGQETIVRKIQSQDDLRFTGESQYMHTTQDRNHGT